MCVRVCGVRVCACVCMHICVYVQARPPPSPPQEPEAHTCQCTLRGSERVKCDSVLARIPNS